MMNSKENKKTALFAAIHAQDMDKLEQLLFHSGFDDVFQALVNEEGDNAFTAAVRLNDRSMINILLEYGMDVNFEKTRTSSSCVLSIACEGCDFETAKYLIDHDANINAEINQKNLSTAAHRNQHDLFMFLIASNANINTKEKNDGWSCLHYAARYNRMNFGEVLIDHGANIDANSDYSYTPLHIAAENGHFEMCKLLVNKKANLESETDEEHLTALQIAEFEQHSEIARYLHGIMVEHALISPKT